MRAKSGVHGGGAWGLPVSRIHLLQHCPLLRPVSDNPLDWGILPLQLLELLGLFELQTVVFLSPAVIALLGYGRLHAGYSQRLTLGHRYFNLPQLRYDSLGNMALHSHVITPK